VWGQNGEGQLGRNDRINRSSPIQVGGDTNWSQAKNGDNYIIASKTNGTLWSWGYNNNGQLGISNRINRSSPSQIGTNTNWSFFVIAGNGNGPIQAASKTDGTLWTWGKNDHGQLGHNDRGVYRSSPTQVAGTTWSANLISGGAYSFTAIKTNGTLWSWGQNSYGQLGFNDTVNRSSPVQVGSRTDWTLVSMGPYAGFAKVS
jgi:alpha-tubulin suppressor-like RCC1 family protein